MKYFITFKVENELKWNEVCKWLYSKGYEWINGDKNYTNTSYISLCINHGNFWYINKIYTTFKSTFLGGETEHYILVNFDENTDVNFIIETYRMNLL